MVQTANIVPEKTSILNIMKIEHFSCLLRLLKIVAFVLRLVHNCCSPEIGTLEKGNAMTKLIMDVQKMDFSHEITNSKRSENAPSLIRQLNLLSDGENVLRCKGRIENSLLPNEVKFPILLPKDNWFTRLVILKAHQHVLHGGVRETLASVRQIFWIPQGRRAIRLNIRNCVTCRKVDGKPYKGTATSCIQII